MTHHLRRAHDGLLRACGEIPGVIVVLVVCGIAVDVVLRNIGVGSIEWMIEVVEYGLFLLTFVGTAYVLRLGRHVTVDIVPGVLPPRPRRYLAILAGILLLVICAIFFYYGVRAALLSRAENYALVKTFTIREWWLLAVLPAAALLLCIEGVRRLRDVVRGEDGEMRRGDPRREGL